jgi:hypothetical protein
VPRAKRALNGDANMLNSFRKKVRILDIAVTLDH